MTKKYIFELEKTNYRNHFLVSLHLGTPKKFKAEITEIEMLTLVQEQSN